MCLIAFAIGASQRWPLVIASNRDEFFDRPTLPLGRWHTSTGQEIISGRDLRAGGTWLGMTTGGRVAFLTNVREAQSGSAPCSRGELVTRWLEHTGTAGDFVLALQQDFAAYGGFNLVLGDFQRNAWMWLTNRHAASSTLHAQPLEPGVYCISNASLNTPWPKTIALQGVLADAMAMHASVPDPHALQKILWTALGNRDRSPREHLPATGVPLAMEEALSSAFVDYPEHTYGTRSSTVLLASAREDSLEDAWRWDVQVQERTHLHYLQTQRKLTDETVISPDLDPGAYMPQSSSCLIVWQQTAAL